MTSPSTDRRFGLSSSVAIKAPVAVATTANITLSGEQTIDGVLTSASRVLVKNQTSGVDNGIYLSDSGTWEREPDCDGARDLVTGSAIHVVGGTAGAGWWECTTTGTIIVGTTSIAFAIIASLSSSSSFTTITVSSTATLNGALVGGATTDSTSPTTGAFKTAGGLGVVKAAWIGGLMNVAGVATFAEPTDASSSTAAGTIVSGGLAVAKKANIGTTLTVGTTATIGGLVDLSGAGAGQVKFPATQNASSDANTLDDYEEGSWTPGLGGSASYTAQYGAYIKVGKNVYYRGGIQVNSIGTGSAIGSMSGLPFASASQAGSLAGWSGCVSYYAVLATNSIFVGIYADNNATTLQVTTSVAAAAQTGNAAIFGNGTKIDFAGTYQAAA